MGNERGSFSRLPTRSFASAQAVGHATGGPGGNTAILSATQGRRSWDTPFRLRDDGHGGKCTMKRQIFECFRPRRKHKKRPARWGWKTNAQVSREGEVVPLRFERGLRVPKTLVLTITPWNNPIKRRCIGEECAAKVGSFSQRPKLSVPF